jgi:hypothetical protein
MRMHLLLGGIVSAVAGCGGSVIDDSNAKAPPACASSDTSLGTITAAKPFDYLELRYDGPPVTTVRSTGKECATATNLGTCTTAFSQITLSGAGFSHVFDGPSDEMVKYYLAFTAGDTVGTITNLADLLAFLGPIDTPDEAVLMATLLEPDTSSDYGFDCASTVVRQNADGSFDVITSQSFCGSEKAQFHVTSDGTVTKVGEVINPGSNCPVARRTAGIPDLRVRSRHPVGRFFENATHLEAMSVHAFRRLDAELRAHGAPATLGRAARSAARDEAVHARLAGFIARRYGARVPRAAAPSLPVRSLADVALENAVEGCIHETHGALVATWQARMAEDPVIRMAMTRIARDEARHASLARRVAAWAEPRLGARARKRIADARRHAIESLRRESARAPDAMLVTRAGMPSPRDASALLDAAERSVF